MEMLKSTAQPYSVMQYLPKVQMMSVKEVPMVSKFISWYTLTSLSALLLAQKALICESALFCRNNLQGSSNFFSKMRSNSPLAYHFKLLINSAITQSFLIRYNSIRLTRMRILNICETVCLEASTFARQTQFYGTFSSSTKSFNQKLTLPDFLRQRRRDFWMGQSWRWGNMLDFQFIMIKLIQDRTRISIIPTRKAIRHIMSDDFRVEKEVSADLAQFY